MHLRRGAMLILREDVPLALFNAHALQLCGWRAYVTNDLSLALNIVRRKQLVLVIMDADVGRPRHRDPARELKAARPDMRMLLLRDGGGESTWINVEPGGDTDAILELLRDTRPGPQ